jgi:hypothetical protein
MPRCYRAPIAAAPHGRESASRESLARTEKLIEDAVSNASLSSWRCLARLEAASAFSSA